MEENTWKVLAIVFISLFILETFIFGGLFLIGSNMIKKETACGNICDVGDYDSYYYDSPYKTCYCFKDGELAKEEIIH